MRLVYHKISTLFLDSEAMYKDPVKQSLAAVGAIPLDANLEKPNMFAFLKKCFCWTLFCWALFFFLCSEIFFMAGFIIGRNDGYTFGQMTGRAEGVNATLCVAQQHHCGLFVAECDEAWQVTNKFIWLDDLAKQLQSKAKPNSDPFNLDPAAPSNKGIFKIGKPDTEDKGASITRPRVMQCYASSAGAVAAAIEDEHRNDKRGPIEKLIVPVDPEKGITTTHSEDPCDPLNFVFFMLFLLLVVGVSAAIAMIATRVHRWRKGRVAH